MPSKRAVSTASVAPSIVWVAGSLGMAFFLLRLR
jgi:hypothetical protein